MNQVDLARFEFDYDTTWTGFFLDADLKVYSRYGGRDHRVADARLSPESLVQTMSEVLDTHRQLLKLPVPERAVRAAVETHPVPVATSEPEDIPLLQENHEGCVHCHQIQEYRHLQAYHDGKFDRRLLFGYPLPEALGISVSRENGHLIDKIIAGSAAESSGLRSGDLVHSVNSIPVRSEYDLRWALHRAPETGPIKFQLRRKTADEGPTDATEVRVDAELTPPPRWRQTDLGWRKSLRSVPLQLGFLGYTLGGEGLKEAGFPPDQSVLKVISIRPPGLGPNLKLEKGDLITGVGGRREYRSFDHFKSRLLELYQPGDTVKVEVMRNGQRIQLEGLFPMWYTSENSVP